MGNWETYNIEGRRKLAYEAREDLEIFQLPELICDRFYELIQTWKTFDQETVGSQFVCDAESVGANRAESYGRYHDGKKTQFSVLCTW